ncbi:SDR family oxidoreductase [Chloroflexota bacterium]
MSKANSRKLFDISGKVALITGGAGLLAFEYAKVLAEHGANIILVDLDDNTCKDRALELERKTGEKAIGLFVDLADKRSIQDMVEKTLDKFRSIDILINNAAVKSPKFFVPFEEFPLKDWETVVAVNLTAVFLCSQVVGRQMLKQGKGVIINIASHYGVVGPDFRIYEGSSINTPPVYSATKAGVVGLTRYLATWWANKNIRVNCVSPGGVYDNQSDDFVQKYSYRVPQGRMAEKTDLQGVILFLASDASSYVTGQNLVIDGGWTAW